MSVKISINKKILGIFLTLVAVFIIFAIGAFLGVQSFRSNLNDAISISRKVNLTGGLQLQVNRILIPVNNYLISGDIRERDNFDRTIGEMSRLFVELRFLKTEERWQSVAKKVEKDSIELGEKAIFILYVDNPVGNKAAKILFSELNQLSEGLVRDVAEFHRTTEDEIAGMDAEISHRIRMGLIYAVVVLVFLSLLVTALYYYLKIAITNPIRMLREGAGIIAKGDLTHRLDVRTGDELGELADEFNRMATEMEIRTRELKKLSVALEQSTNAVFISDVQGRIEYVNPMFEKITGWQGDEAVGQTPRIFAGDDTPASDYEDLWKTILAGKAFSHTFRNKRKDGRPYWAKTLIIPIKDESGNITHFLSMQEDITEKKKAEETAEFLTNYDDLTGLFNRTRFMDILNGCISGYEKDGDSIALLLIDIDGFKFINDTYGHLTGDNFLKSAGAYLLRAAKGIDASSAVESVIARLGADEFAVLLRRVNAQTAYEAAEEVRKKFEGFRSADGLIHSSISIGIAVYPEHGGTGKELLARADVAVYRAKKDGRNRCHLYQPEDHDLEKIHSRLAEKDRILLALAEGQFVPWLQPILDLKGSGIHHYEALARLQKNDGTVLQPSEFIDTAEIFGLIGEVDRVIIAKAVSLLAGIHAAGRGELSFSINLSGKDLGDTSLLVFLKSMIFQEGIDPGKLIFEITETAAIHNMETALAFINGLKDIGCHFSLDDFGVGFTSFLYLKEMGVDYVKIDGSFIKTLCTDGNNQLFVKAIVDVARGMGIKTIAEFVENEETIKLLREFGVDFAQGYAIGKPAPWDRVNKT